MSVSRRMRYSSCICACSLARANHCFSVRPPWNRGLPSVSGPALGSSSRTLVSVLENSWAGVMLGGGFPKPRVMSIPFMALAVGDSCISTCRALLSGLSTLIMRAACSSSHRKPSNISLFSLDMSR
uniref:Putative secreted protein n=1 Tax=Ixodes ricinus TaxID=34613 RepID=A0A6B0UPX3_IXORI